MNASCQFVSSKCTAAEKDGVLADCGLGEFGFQGMAQGQQLGDFVTIRFCSARGGMGNGILISLF